MLSCSWGGADVCKPVSLSHWSQRPAVAQTHTHCRACGVSSTATALRVSAIVCVSVCVCLFVWLGVQSESSCLCPLSPPPAPPSLCKHLTSAVITGKPVEALSPLPTSKLYPLNPAPPNMVDTNTHIKVPSSHCCIGKT